MIAAGLVSVGIVVGFGMYSSARQAAVNRDMTRVSNGVSDQWNADMMHDALRADVMSALYANTPQDRTTYEVDAVAEHASALLENFDAAAIRRPLREKELAH